MAEGPKVHLRNGDRRKIYEDEKLLSPGQIFGGKTYRAVHLHYQKGKTLELLYDSSSNAVSSNVYSTQPGYGITRFCIEHPAKAPSLICDVLFQDGYFISAFSFTSCRFLQSLNAFLPTSFVIIAVDKLEPEKAFSTSHLPSKYSLTLAMPNALLSGNPWEST